jgi:hypothetical protein
MENNENCENKPLVEEPKKLEEDIVTNTVNIHSNVKSAEEVVNIILKTESNIFYFY